MLKSLMFEGEKGWPSREKSAGGFPSHWTGPGANPAGRGQKTIDEP